MNLSSETKELFSALSAAQSEVGSASKAKMNPAYKSKYADLESVWDEVQPLLGKYGLVVLILPSNSGVTDRIEIDYVIGHVSGQSVSGTYGSPVSKQDPQGFGGAITYARRYLLMAFFGIICDDDDGNSSSNVTPKETMATAEMKANLKKISDRKGLDLPKDYDNLTHKRYVELMTELTK